MTRNDEGIELKFNVMSCASPFIRKFIAVAMTFSSEEAERLAPVARNIALNAVCSDSNVIPVVEPVRFWTFRNALIFVITVIRG